MHVRVCVSAPVENDPAPPVEDFCTVHIHYIGYEVEVEFQSKAELLDSLMGLCQEHYGRLREFLADDVDAATSLDEEEEVLLREIQLYVLEARVTAR